MDNYKPEIKIGSELRILTEDNYELAVKVISINHNSEGLSKLIYEIEDVIIHDKNCKCNDEEDKKNKKK